MQMNIFALSPDTSYAADMHCDQHLHKMILESAQMLSTLVYDPPAGSPSKISALIPHVYKSSYRNHPCSIWTRESWDNAWWLCNLAFSLESIRETLDHPSHASIRIIQMIADHIELHASSTPQSFVFCGPAIFKLRYSLNVHERYQAFYRYKQSEWLKKGLHMSYKNREIPSFLSDLEILS
jgi:hypothetical protein